MALGAGIDVRARRLGTWFYSSRKEVHDQDFIIVSKQNKVHSIFVSFEHEDSVWMEIAKMVMYIYLFILFIYLSCFSRVAPSVGYTLLYMEALRVHWSIRYRYNTNIYAQNSMVT